MKKNDAKKTWDGIGNMWAKMIVPNRPSQGDCEVYGSLARRELNNKKNPKIMLMGATPELRRVLYTFEYLQKADVYCVDINPDIYKAMSNFVMKVSGPREKFLKRSWLSTGFRDKTFDLVIGDEVICNVPHKEHENLFREISRVLKDGGAWITRHNYFTKRVERTKRGEILAELAKKVEEGFYDFQYAVNVLMAKAFYYSGWVDESENTLRGHLKIMQREAAVRSRGSKLKKIIEELLYMYKRNFVDLGGKYKWVMLSKAESDRELGKHFVIAEGRSANDYLTAECSPIYLLRKKKLSVNRNFHG